MDRPLDYRPEIVTIQCGKCGNVWSTMDPKSKCAKCFLDHLRANYTPELRAQVEAALANDQKLFAVKIVKDHFEISLREAMEFVDDLGS